MVMITASDDSGYSQQSCDMTSSDSSQPITAQNQIGASRIPARQARRVLIGGKQRGPPHFQPTFHRRPTPTPQRPITAQKPECPIRPAKRVSSAEAALENINGRGGGDKEATMQAKGVPLSGGCCQDTPGKPPQGLTLPAGTRTPP